MLGHVQRGGAPCAFDRELATRFGVKAVELIAEGKFGHVAALEHGKLVAKPIDEGGQEAQARRSGRASSPGPRAPWASSSADRSDRCDLLVAARGALAPFCAQNIHTAPTCVR